jgi:hypothetical protein
LSTQYTLLVRRLTVRQIVVVVVLEIIAITGVVSFWSAAAAAQSTFVRLLSFLIGAIVLSCGIILLVRLDAFMPKTDDDDKSDGQ